MTPRLGILRLRLKFRPWKYEIVIALLIGVIVLLLAGCAAPPGSDSPVIPHLLYVTNGVYRSGQPPANINAVQALALLGVTNVVKLDYGTESFGPAVRVQYFDINLLGQLVEPSDREVHAAVNAIGPDTLVHCENGNDRTGLIVACYRLKCGWSKAEAEKEMLANGFHKSELGLLSYWKRQRVEDWR